MVSAFVIGPIRTGTTLMITLLADHPQLSVIPLEVKFYEHYYNSLGEVTDGKDLMVRILMISFFMLQS